MTEDTCSSSVKEMQNWCPVECRSMILGWAWGHQTKLNTEIKYLYFHLQNWLRYIEKNQPNRKQTTILSWKYSCARD